MTLMRDSSSCWQKNLAQGFASASELLGYLQLSVTNSSPIAETQFKTRVPRGFAARMQKGNANDPLLLQVLAVAEELIETAGYGLDPLEEKKANPHKGLIHKYHGRVLLTLTGSCAINCRYCFRRHFPYQDNNPGRQGWQTVIDYIARDETIHEVILSGGDPLLAPNAIFKELLLKLETINHLQTLRIHSRMPVVLPERIDKGLLDLLTTSRLSKVIVIHSNHSQELDSTVAKACQKLKLADCHLLNQSVLLAGINDNVQVLADLSHRLFALGVLPYYLHLLDKVQGAAHFDLTRVKALAIYHELQKRLPGYLVPKLAQEEPGKGSKSLII